MATFSSPRTRTKSALNDLCLMLQGGTGIPSKTGLNPARNGDRGMGLVDSGKSKTYRVSEEELGGWTVSRKDTAKFVVDVVQVPIISPIQ